VYSQAFGAIALERLLDLVVVASTDPCPSAGQTDVLKLFGEC
jgi:hypothetical protein